MSTIISVAALIVSLLTLGFVIDIKTGIYRLHRMPGAPPNKIAGEKAAERRKRFLEASRR